jgi:hypothetical protein
MFYLAGTDFPATAEQLTAALTGSLQKFMTLPTNRSVVSATGGAYPQIDQLRIDLSGSVLNLAARPPRPVGVGPRQEGIQVGRLEITGRPVRLQDAGLNLNLTADGARFDFDRNKENAPLLMLSTASSGKVEAGIARKDIESLLLSGASAAAKKQGVAIEETQLTLNSKGPRSVGMDVRVRAKKGLFGATVHIVGQLDVDDEMTARISGLNCSGEGMIGSVVCGFITPYLQRYDGKQVPLMAFSMGDVRLRDLQLRTQDGLQVTAAFGS